MNRENDNNREIVFKSIGTIRTPYKDWAPFQPIEQGKEIGKFVVEVDEEYLEALKNLESFDYIMLIYYCDRIKEATKTAVTPPWAKGKKVGMFASRTPARPNPIGISIVRLEKIEGNTLITWPLDIFDKTPLLDIKPYIATLDAKKDANDGWLDSLEGKEHLLDHVRGLPHNHSHDHHHHHEDQQHHSEKVKK